MLSFATRGVVLLAGLLVAALGFAQSIPAPLQAWQGWVLHGHESEACPAHDAGDDTRRCRWPGELRLSAGTAGIEFEQTWTLYAPQRVPLPGDAQRRPVDVDVDGSAAPVVMDGAERPWLALAAGVHRVRGRIEWPRRPSTLNVPAEIALIALTLDGATVPRPERNIDGELVLGAVGADESDDLQIEVYRLLGDGVPQLLATRVHFSVSGRPREQSFPSLLPAGFVPVALDSAIPARLEADGRLRVQLRSGSWALTLIARALEPQLSLARQSAVEPWPVQEIWQFRAAPDFRVAQLVGLPGVDPNQTALPDWEGDMEAAAYTPWHDLLVEADSLPAYLFNHETSAELQVNLRGLPLQRPARLSLRRELWLDFDGAGFSANDRITGQLGSASRLDLRAPWQMQRAQRDEDSGLLITTPADPALNGVELREPEVDIEVDSRVSREGIANASGWTQPFDHASAVLHLPPGYRLLAATGADRAGGSWWQAWNLLDLFLLSVIALLAWRLGGPLLLLTAVAWGVLAWHEPDAPRVSVLLMLLFALIARHMVGGRLGTFMRLLGAASALLVVLIGLGFAAAELRLALYPQLEQHGVMDPGVSTAGYLGSPAVVEASFNEPPPPPRPRAQKSRSADEDSETLDQVTVTGTRIRPVDLFSYPADAIVQSGAARPNWNWRRHDISWNGPLLPDDAFGLIVSPPLLTRVWRIAAVLLLVALLWRVLRPGTIAPRVVPRSSAALVLLPLLALGVASQSRAQALPDAELLDALRERLLARNETCRPNCAALGAVVVAAQRERLVLALDAHAQADVVWPLPRTDAALALVAVRLDGVAAAVLRDTQGDWLHVTRGVHRIEVEYVPDGERWRIAFPLPPATIRLRAPGFEAIGLDEERLVGDTLELVPPRDATSAQDDAPQGIDDVSEAIPAFVKVQRSFVLDQRWEMTVRVTRVAPARSGINLAIPLLPDEQPFQDAPTIREGRAIVSLPAGVDSIEWRSRLTPVPTLVVTAGNGREYSEEWRLMVAPLLHAEVRGLPESGEEEGYPDDGVRRFLPLPGESIQIDVTRPEAVAGARVAIENVTLATTPGQRARDATLSFELRATQAGQHTVTLPPDAELLGLRIDGEPQPLVIDRGQLRLPLRPAVQQIAIDWREPAAVAARISTPAVALGASASNLRLSIDMPQDRWLLLTGGPRVGPAVLVWGEMLVMLLVAVALGRIGRTPLRAHHWLLLGLGFSTLSWIAAAIVAIWLLTLAWRARRVDLVDHRIFPWLQLALFAFSAIALLALVIAVPYGLLGHPDMHVVGNGSSATNLQWFADRSGDGAMPSAWAISVPMWIYKLAILAWSIWLANALVAWLRWAGTCLGAGGWWRPIFRRKAKTIAETLPASSAG
jgi:hypothetical protein